MIIEPAFVSSILDSLKDPLVFADTNHIIRYMNKAGVEQNEKRGGADLIGQSLLACHNESSQRQILEILAEMRNGLEERLIADDERGRAYMRAVRDDAGSLIGYYERYEAAR